jgi:hypothetical protein
VRVGRAVDRAAAPYESDASIVVDFVCCAGRTGNGFGFGSTIMQPLGVYPRFHTSGRSPQPLFKFNERKLDHCRTLTSDLI